MAQLEDAQAKVAELERHKVNLNRFIDNLQLDIRVLEAKLRLERAERVREVYNIKRTSP